MHVKLILILIRIVKKVYLNKLPFKVSENQFRELVATTTHSFLDVCREKEKNKGN